MTTHISSDSGDRYAKITARGDRVYLSIHTPVDSRSITLDRTQFIDSLRAEGFLPDWPPTDAQVAAFLGVETKTVPADAVVIQHEDLPEVTEILPGSPGEYLVGGNRWSDKYADELRPAALARLALAEYLDAHPPKQPIDRQMVNAFVGILARVDGRSLNTKAEALYAAGVRIEAAK